MVEQGRPNVSDLSQALPPLLPITSQYLHSAPHLVAAEEVASVRTAPSKQILGLAVYNMSDSWKQIAHMNYDFRNPTEGNQKPLNIY